MAFHRNSNFVASKIRRTFTVSTNNISRFISIQISHTDNMSLGYPPLRPQPEGARPVELPTGAYGVPDVMMHGFQNAKAATVTRHPLEHSEANWLDNQRQMDFSMLRNTQGLHAPLRLQMERNIASKFHRLPCLHSSNLLEDTLTGRDDQIDFSDVLNSPSEAESIGQAHILMEKSLRIL